LIEKDKNTSAETTESAEWNEYTNKHALVLVILSDAQNLACSIYTKINTYTYIYIYICMMASDRIIEIHSAQKQLHNKWT